MDGLDVFNNGCNALAFLEVRVDVRELALVED